MQTGKHLYEFFCMSCCITKCLRKGLRKRAPDVVVKFLVFLTFSVNVFMKTLIKSII